MTISLQSANVYGDLQGLEKLKHSNESDSPETLRFVAEQFEALFMQMMLKSAHVSDQEDGLFDSEQTEFYQDWYDKQLAIHLSSGQGVGIADMLVQQLKQRQLAGDKSSQAENSTMDEFVNKVNPRPRHSLSVPISSLREPATTEQPALNSPQSFIKHLLPMATEAGRRLGVSPQVLLAQAALETGWGTRITRSAEGESSHNLFNIKADHRWQGDLVNVPTLEYRDGIARPESAHFRAYDSYQASFDDYVEFIQTGPRYQKALSVADDNRAYTHELAQAGYATDPDYSSKIMEIANGDPMNESLQTVKL